MRRRYCVQVKPNMKVGWFLHTPFPSSEIYRALPRREEILRGVLKVRKLAPSSPPPIHPLPSALSVCVHAGS
jgi:hypothetical protein